MADLGEWRPGRAYDAGDRVRWLGAGLVAAKTHESPAYASSPFDVVTGGDGGLYPEEDLFPDDTLVPEDPSVPVSVVIGDSSLWRAATPIDAMALRQNRLSVPGVAGAVPPAYPRVSRRA